MSQRTLRVCDSCDAEIKSAHVNLASVCDFCVDCARRLTLEQAENIRRVKTAELAKLLEQQQRAMQLQGMQQNASAAAQAFGFGGGFGNNQGGKS